MFSQLMTWGTGEHIFHVCMPCLSVSSRLCRELRLRKELFVEGGLVPVVFTSSTLGSQPVHLVVVGMLWSSQLSQFSCSTINQKHVNLVSLMGKCFSVLHSLTCKTKQYLESAVIQSTFISCTKVGFVTHTHSHTFSSRGIGMNPLSSKYKKIAT